MLQHSFFVCSKAVFQPKKRAFSYEYKNIKSINGYFNNSNKKQKLANSDNVCYIFVEANRFDEI